MPDMVKTATAFVESEAKEELEKCKTVEDKVRAAFKVAKDHWMFTDENIQMNAGLYAAALHCSEEEINRLKREMDFIRSLSAGMSGVDVNMPDYPEDAVDILGIWAKIE